MVSDSGIHASRESRATANVRAMIIKAMAAPVSMLSRSTPAPQLLIVPATIPHPSTWRPDSRARLAAAQGAGLLSGTLSTKQLGVESATTTIAHSLPGQLPSWNASRRPLGRRRMYGRFWEAREALGKATKGALRCHQYLLLTSGTRRRSEECRRYEFRGATGAAVPSITTLRHSAEGQHEHRYGQHSSEI
jgi:hypothetical protein